MWIGGKRVPERHSSPGNPTDRHSAGTALAPRLVARWLLLGVVIAAVFGLHVLTVHHGDHGDLPTAVTAGSLSEPQDVVELSGMPAAVAGAMALGLDSPILPSDDGDGWLGGCILFLVVAGQGLSLLLMLIRRRISDPPMVEPGGGQVAVSWRPAAPAAPRSALGVLRI